MVNRALWAAALLSLAVFMWVCHPAVWLGLAVGFGLLAATRTHNQRAAERDRPAR